MVLNLEYITTTTTITTTRKLVQLESQPHQLQFSELVFYLFSFFIFIET